GGKIDFFSQERNGMIQISISDNGVGMPQEVADKLFSIDFKLSTKGTNKEEGTGLGLKICKEFVEKNKGKIYVESAVNKGTTFFVSFPMPV
ncbi:MAG: sensor histidine kinase, partial [Bacteroidetes bacterium]